MFSQRIQEKYMKQVRRNISFISKMIKTMREIQYDSLWEKQPKHNIAGSKESQYQKVDFVRPRYQLPNPNVIW